MHQFKDKVSVWYLLNNEAATASGLICNGLTLLRKMDFTKNSIQDQAFFLLSIGMERLMKLILIYDYRTINNNSIPDDSYLRKGFGHDLTKLFDKCKSIAAFHNIDTPLIDDPIYQVILNILTDFSNQSRYYNLNYLSGNFIGKDCIKHWEVLVNKEIMKRHTNATPPDYEDDIEIKHNPQDDINERINKATYINFLNWNKNGKYYEEKAKYSMYYTYQLIHYLTTIIYDLASQKLMPFINEHFRLFLNTNQEFILNKKYWDNYEVNRNE